MKRIFMAASLLLSSSVMYADLVPVLVSITPAANNSWSWNYSLNLGPGDEVAPAVGLSPGATQAWPNFFTIIDFGSPTSVPLSVPSGWGGNASIPNADTAFGISPSIPNQPNISDIEINYTGSTVVKGPATITGFSFLSPTNQEALGWYEGQGTKGSSDAPGTEQGNVGRVPVPLVAGSNLQQVPEPATFVLLGSSLIGLGFLRRRKI